MDNCKNQKILIVEDDETLVKVLIDKFTKKGFSVLSAKNGQIGLELALAEKPQLILLDIMMPVMDGMELLKKLREDLAGKDIPVIILSNLSSIDITSKANKLGVVDCLVKIDCNLEEVVKKVESNLSK